MSLPFGSVRKSGIFSSCLGKSILCFAAPCTILIFSLVLIPSRLSAQVPPISRELTGGEFEYVVKKRDTVRSISSRLGVAPKVIAADNGLKSPNSPLTPGQTLRIDNRHIVPRTVARGIVVNLPQRILFFFDGGQLVAHYPAGIGRPSWPAPVTTFSVTGKRENPTWIVPVSIQQEMEDKGEEVLDEVPPGPDNPLGQYAINLSIPGYLIHGTIAPASIYQFKTHGCFRLHPADVEDLFRRVAQGDAGETIYEPVLLAALPDGRIFVEINKDAYEKGSDPLRKVRESAEIEGLGGRIDWRAVDMVIANADGIAHQVDAR
jgi:L,D-transpeptidase ErfK/SrfK